MTCVPILAAKWSVSRRPNLQVGQIKLTKFRDEITSEKSSAAKDGDNMTAHCAVARCSIRNDWFTVRKRDHVMQSPLPKSTQSLQANNNTLKVH